MIIHKLKVTALIWASVGISIAAAQVKPNERKKVAPPADAKHFWLFLLAGQSNMAGRGTVEPIDTLPNVKVLTLNKDGNWEIAKDPIHFDRSYAGVGPGLTFGKAMADQQDTIYIGLIPCAVGGSSINSWKPGGAGDKPNNYTAAVERTRTAMQSGVLKGVIWFQGETDCTETGVVGYDEKLTNVIAGMRTDLGNTKLPFIAGELPAFQMQQPDKAQQLQDNPYVSQINQMISGLKGKITFYDYVTSEGTDHRGDHLHFNSASARLIGLRYAKLMHELLKAK